MFKRVHKETSQPCEARLLNIVHDAEIRASFLQLQRRQRGGREYGGISEWVLQRERQQDLTEKKENERQ